MGIVLKNISTSDKTAKSGGARCAAQLDYIAKGEKNTKVMRVWYGNTLGVGRIADAEIIALVNSNTRATNPTRHLMTSWRNDESKPNQREFEGAIRNTLKEMDLSDCLYKASVHLDTDHIHLHLVVCTVDPVNSKMRHTPMIEDRCQKVIARHNHEFKRPSQPGDRYVMVAGKPVLKSAARPDSPPVIEKAERATAHGKESAIDVAKGRVNEHGVGDAASWPEFHHRLAAAGMSYEQVGKNMAKVTLSAYQGGDEYLKASQLKWTLVALEKKFGPYQAAAKTLEPARQDAAAKEVVKQAEKPKPWDIFKQEKATYILQSKEEEKGRKLEHAAQRGALAAKQKKERVDLQGAPGFWLGRGFEFNGAKSLLAKRQAVEKIELKEKQRGEWKAAKENFPDWNDWRKAHAAGKDAKPVAPAPEVAGLGGDGRPMTPRGDLRDFKGRFVASGQVEYTNRFTEQVEFIDAGKKLTFGQDFGDPAIRASLQLAAQKWSVGPLNIGGTDAFKRANALEGVRLGIDSRLAGIDAAMLEAARVEVAAEREAMKTAAAKDAQRVQEATKAERLIVMAEKNRHSTRLLGDAEGNQKDRLPVLGMAQAREQGEAVRMLPVVKDQIHFDLDLQAAGLAQFKKDGGKPAFVQAGAKPGQFVAVVGVAGNRHNPAVMQQVDSFKSDLLKRYGPQGETLMAHGKAPFEYQEAGSKSYFVRTRNADGVESEQWGVDLERAVKEAAVKPGDLITLRRAGQQEVKVNAPVKGPDGKPTGELQEKIVKRNGWEVKTIQKSDELPGNSAKPNASKQDPVKPGEVIETGNAEPCKHTQAEFEKHSGMSKAKSLEKPMDKEIEPQNKATKKSTGPGF